ncbi:MAG: hypothetical protein MZV49_27445 [Rhodopseudomonas palustris]|nr:hypothetical protein [Rhodopseudomonas palustris]
MVTREEITRCLQIDWDAYLASFDAMPEIESCFPCPPGLSYLCRAISPPHCLVARWHAGHPSSPVDPEYHHPQMDVDAFNQAAIDGVSGLSDAVVIAELKAARQELVDFVNNLTDADLANPKINLQLLIEIIEHLEEHQ